MAIKRNKVTADLERKIVTGLIVDDHFCRRIEPMIETPDFLEVGYIKRIVGWIKDYYDKYHRTPGKHIQDIYRLESDGLDEDESALIAEFLDSLSSSYESEQDVNWDFYGDRARDYFRGKAIDKLNAEITALKDQGRLDEAEQRAQQFRTYQQTISEWSSPLEDDDLLQRAIEEDDRYLFRLGGDLGEYVGGFKRGWLVSFLGPVKRGKTWYMIEPAFHALHAGLSVAFISLEMKKTELTKRFMQRWTALGQHAGTYLMPQMDCVKNQVDDCTLPIREGSSGGLSAEACVDPSLSSGYQPCTACRRNPGYLQNFAPTSVLRDERKRHNLYSRGIEQTKKVKEWVRNGKLKIRSFPRFGASLDDIEAELDSLYVDEDFVPDVVVIDYADIMAYDGNEQGRDRYDETWKRLGRLAGERHCLVITASQSNKASIDAEDVQESAVAEDMRKLAHVDMMLTLSQTKPQKRKRKLNNEEQFESGSGDAEISEVVPGERDRMIMRVGMPVFRHGVIPSDQVYVLQQLSLGQPHLDSYARSVQRKKLEEEHEYEL